MVDVIAPYADVAVGALAFDGVVPTVGNQVAIDVGVAIGTSLEAEVAGAADAIVETVVFGGAVGVVADDVFAARIDQRDALRAGRMAALPIVGAAARILNQVALQNQVAGVVLGIDSAIHVA